MANKSKLEELNQEIIQCRKCARLVAWREEVARVKRRAYVDQEYWGKPVPGFGDPNARVVSVGLAPGAHGSNRTGRNFTGDASGGFLYPALHRAGFANQPTATHRGDGLALQDLYLTASGRCAPPANKPTPAELDNCQSFLERELEILKPQVIVCLGSIAFARVMRIYSIRNPTWKFGHGALYMMENGPYVLCSYHPSQQNTQTGRLTPLMFDEIWTKARSLLR
ncbi:MAG TPA: uracil-DNA glycosylase [Thermodesulfobacteriota bacterium]|nr:uracil-DNA glycosylase [Thermodesulfobacteriota bacterium]